MSNMVLPHSEYSEAIGSIVDQVDEYLAIKKDSDLYTDEQVEVLYSIAYGYWKVGLFEKALHGFMVVLCFRPKNIKYIEAVARCHVDMQQYIEAINMFSLSILCNGVADKNMLNMAQCYIYIGFISEASTILEGMEGLFSSEKSSQDVMKKSRHLLSLIKKHASSVDHNPAVKLH